jgi:rfaE bifunctional protein nucleotidyltransferase chain/domain
MLANKFVDFDSLEYWRCIADEPVVAVNGCFDVIHAGHVRMLQFAAQHGRLIVGINSDDSVKYLKGPTRPINTQTNRAAVVAAFECVAAVTIFEDSTATKFLSRLKPDFWIKGGDYTLDSINQQERIAVEENMGRIRFFSLLGGLSSSAIIERLS